MTEQAILAYRLQYDAVSLTEHHLINILMMPAPLQFACKLTSVTKQVKIMTCIVVLPLPDMRIYAGEVVCSDIFTDQRDFEQAKADVKPFLSNVDGLAIWSDEYFHQLVNKVVGVNS
jgi:hypothetical protein